MWQLGEYRENENILCIKNRGDGVHMAKSEKLTRIFYIKLELLYGIMLACAGDLFLEHCCF